MSKKRVVIVGGGFAGVQCARALVRGRRHIPLEIVLFNRENHLVFSPLLAEVAGSTLNPLDIIVPLRQLLPTIFCRTEEVRHIDFKEQSLEYIDESGRLASMHYDHVVISPGSLTNLNVMPGMSDHGLPLKTVADAADMRSHVMEEMEKAEVSTDPERRRWHLTFLVVGGGFSGVEAAGELNDLVRSSARYYRNWRAEDARVVLIHSRDEILPEISPRLRSFARRKMEEAGVEMQLNARVSRATPLGVSLSDGRFLDGATIICTIGNSPAHIVQNLDLPKNKGRLVTEPDMRLPAIPNAWAIGDCAWIINHHDGQVSPTTGQFAERQGRQCGENILRALQQEPTKRFRFKKLGELCSIGGHSAVADFSGFRLSGFIAWFLWRGIYLFKLPTLGRRVQVGFDWATLLVFPRDLAHIRTQRTDRVAHAHYSPGDFIFRAGEAPTNFYVLEKGEVEVVRPSNGSDPEVVSVLGAGSFFGEKALLNDCPRVMSIRARTPVEVLVMGKNVFDRISGALVPFKEALAKTLNRRAVDVWQNQPEVHELLKRTPVRDLMEPIPQPLLTPDSTLREAGRAFVDHKNEFFFVSSQVGASQVQVGASVPASPLPPQTALLNPSASHVPASPAADQPIEGVLTITDFIRDRGVPLSGDTPVRDFMTRNPITVAADDDCALAVAAMREYRLKTLPVVDHPHSRNLVGCLRIRRIMAFVLKELAPTVKPAIPSAHDR